MSVIQSVRRELSQRIVERRAERQAEQVERQAERRAERQAEQSEREATREATRETIETLRNEILSLECYITKNQQKPRPGEQFFFAVHVLPMRSVYNKIAGLRNKIALIEREERQAPQKKRELLQQERETSEHKISVFKAKIEWQENLYNGLRKGGHDIHTPFVVCEKKKLDQLNESFKTFLRGGCSVKEKLACMTEEEKDLMYERIQERKKERNRLHTRDFILLRELS